MNQCFDAQETSLIIIHFEHVTCIICLGLVSFLVVLLFAHVPFACLHGFELSFWLL